VRDFKPRPKAKPTNIGNTLLGIFIGLLLGLLMAAAIAIYMMKSPFPWSKSKLSDRTPVEAKDPERAAKSGDEAKLARSAERSDKPRFDFYRILPGQDSGAAADSSALPTDRTGAPRDAGKTDRSDAARADAGKAEGSKADAARADAARTDAAKEAKAESAKAESARSESARSESAKADGAKSEAGRELARADVSARQSFLLQAGSFQNPAEADNVKAKLALLGLESNIETVDLPDRGTWYRVRMGPYKSLNEVNHVRSQLAQSGIDVSLVRNNPTP